MTDQLVIINPGARPEVPVTAPQPSSIPAFPLGNPLQNPQLWANPYPLYRMLRENNPVLRIPIPSDETAGVWLLTRHEDVHATLRDPRFSVDRLRADLVRRNRERLPSGLLGTTGGLRSMLIMDPPDHTRVRGLVSKAFTPRRVARLRPRIEAIVDELLAEVEPAGRMDVIRDLAEPLPAIVIAELLGVPAENHRQFRQWTTRLLAQLNPGNPLDGLRNAEEALRPILDYLRGIIAERRRAPRDDLISAMIHAQEERDALTDHELLATSNLLLIAGHETTTNLIGNGLLALLECPAELERLRSDPGLLRSGIEELLRYDSPVQATVRIPTQDVALGGHTLREGALVICGIGAANRDPSVFAEPDRLDVGRTENRHLSFGFGVHFCLGAPLARLEAEVAFAALLARFPKLRREEGELGYRPNPALRGLTGLPVAF
jgi:pimeloyl-[acyl-carrier protein] synthase